MRFPKDSCVILPRRNGNICWAAEHHLIYYPNVFGRSLSDSDVLKGEMILIMFLCEERPIC